MGVITMVAFVIFGKALLETIDKSLQNQKQHRQPQGTTDGAANRTLLEAKRKVKTVMVADVVLVVSGSSITLLAVNTGFDTEVPLVMFGVTFAYLPLIFLACNVQVHGGRSGAHRRLVSPLSSRLRSPGSRLWPSLRSKIFSFSNQQQQVVPTEAPY